MKLTQNKQFASLMKDEDNNMGGGVLSGVGKFTGIDTTALRITFVVLGLLGLFLDASLFVIVGLAYAAGYFLMPNYSKENDKETYEYRIKTGTSATGD